jgi:signal transduction histidine kinase/FixJ family two-component response regulator
MLEFLLSGQSAERHFSIRGIVAAGLLLILGIVITTTLMIGNFRERALLTTRHELENVVLLLSRHFDQQLEDYVDAQARLTTQLGVPYFESEHDFRTAMAAPHIRAMLASEVEGLFGLNTIRLYDADGIQINASNPDSSSVADIAGSRYFEAFRSNSTPSITFAEPVQGRNSDRWTIILARKLVNSDGVFLGVMTRRIDPSRFDKFLESITLRDGAWIAMLHRDGQFFAQFPKLGGGNDATITARLQDLVSESDRGSAELTDTRHHSVLLASARRMRNFPIALVATMTTSAALADWREQTKLLIVVAVLLATVIIAVFLLIGRRWSGEQRLAEDRLALGKQQLDMALTSMTQGLCMFDEDERLVVCNSRFRELYGLSENQTRPGVSFSEIASVQVMTDDAFAMSVAENDRDGLPHHDQVRRLLDGRAILVRRTPTRNRGWLLTHEDITDRERVASQLANRLAEQIKAQRKLEAQKSELIATTKALSEARDTAEAASRSKSDFLAMMSHEIRTPMAGMMGMIDLLNGTVLNEEQQDLARVAHDSARNLLAVLNDILDFSKLEAGQLKAESIDFSIRHAVNGVVSLLGPKAAGQGLTLESVLPPDIPLWFKGDPSRIGQILLNLVGNAIKFTERGSVRVTVTHRDMDHGAAELRFDVIDTGAGIPADVLPTLFSPFTQADTSVSRKYGGTGLGLAICKQLCLTMRGDIGVDSEIDRGSRFWFTVMVEPGQPPDLVAPPLQADVAPDTDTDISILIAEDNPVIRSLITKLLARRGYHAEQVTNGSEAVAAIQAKSYDLVLMDMQMPVLDGISATRLIRALAGPERGVPIIALTANALVGQREDCLAAGMNTFLTKPIQPDALYQAITRWARRPGERAVSAHATDASGADKAPAPSA